MSPGGDILLPARPLLGAGVLSEGGGMQLEGNDWRVEMHAEEERLKRIIERLQ